MPCSYFRPCSPADWSGSYPRLPLGEAWNGVCAADPSAPEYFAPQGALLFEVCNTGQGRARCSRFPKDSPRDSVRFHVVEDRGDRLLIRYVFENECWPAGHGVTEFSVSTGLLSPSPENSLLGDQITAFVKTWVKRRPRS
ncbi:MAG TPA: hypothetical protein VHD76_14175 [Bryobacteraceae bacterium]|jgi:hypothetical protein|nr:hypothetical protein [Bryobacteraceae bacterium]